MIPSLDKDYRTNFLFIFVAWITMLLENKKKADRKKTLYRFSTLPYIHYTFKDCSTCAGIKIPKYCSKMLYCRWWSSRHEKNLPYSGLSGTWRNCEERFALLCCISINGSLLWNAEVKEKGSRWNWIPWFIHCTREAKSLIVWPSQSRIYFGFFYELSSGSFVDLSKENSFVCKKTSFATPLPKRYCIL